MRKNFRNAGWIFLATVVLRIGVSYLAYWLQKYIVLNELYLLFLSQLSYVVPSIIYICCYKEDSELKFAELKFAELKSTELKSTTKKSFPSKELLHIKKINIVTVILLVVIAFMSLPILAAVNAFSMLFTENEVTNVIGGMMKGHSYMLLVGIIAFMPAVLEEGVYRGVLFGEYSKKGVWKGAFLSAILFGLMHLNLNQMLYAMVLGIIMAITVEVTGSIFSSMIIHFTLNGYSVTTMYLLSLWKKDVLDTVDTMNTSKEMIGTISIFFAIIGIVALAGVITMLWIISKVEKREEIFRKINPFTKHKCLGETDNQKIPWEACQNKTSFQVNEHSYKVEKECSLISLPLLLGILGCVVIIINEF